MLPIPYIKQPDKNSCALASYAMVAKYFFPDITFEEIAKISDWQKGYVIWAFKFWIWIMNKGIKIIEYDLLDYKAWANEGVEGLKKSVSKREFNFYIKNTKNIESYSNDILEIIRNKNFKLFQERPKFEILEKAAKRGEICEVVLDSGTIRNEDWFSLHRVVILDIQDDKVVYHDPYYGPNMKSDKNLFVKAWLEAVSEPELCIYKR